MGPSALRYFQSRESDNRIHRLVPRPVRGSLCRIEECGHQGMVTLLRERHEGRP